MPRSEKFSTAGLDFFSGKDKYVVDLEGAEELSIHIRFHSLEELTVWLQYPELLVPYKADKSLDLLIKTRYCTGVIFTCSKKNSFVASVSTKDSRRLEDLDYTPVEIAPPRPIDMALTGMVQQELHKQMLAMGIDPSQVEVDDEDLEFGEEPDEFGEGFMETDDPDDEPVPQTPTPQEEPKPQNTADSPTRSDTDAPNGHSSDETEK